MKLNIKSFLMGSAVTTGIIGSVTGVAVLIHKNFLKPDYAIDKVDEHLLKADSYGEKLTSSKGGGAVELSYSSDVKVIKKEKKVNLKFKNPSVSNQDMAIRITLNKDDKEYVIAESNRIPAGYVLKELDLKSGAKLDSGNYDGVIHVYYFDPESLERAIINTDIAVKIVVE